MNKVSETHRFIGVELALGAGKFEDFVEEFNAHFDGEAYRYTLNRAIVDLLDMTLGRLNLDQKNNQKLLTFAERVIAYLGDLYRAHPERMEVIDSKKINEYYTKFYDYCGTPCTGTASIVEMLTSHFDGYNINQVDQAGKTLLMAITRSPVTSAEDLQHFIRLGVDVDTVHPLHGQALHHLNIYQPIKNAEEKLHVLLANGADPDAHTPFQWCHISHQGETVHFNSFSELVDADIQKFIQSGQPMLSLSEKTFKRLQQSAKDVLYQYKNGKIALNSIPESLSSRKVKAF